MASINYAAREISVKIVYYGPGLSGKTTNLQVIHKKVPKDYRSDMVSLATETDRTLFFDFLPLNLGKIRGFATKFQLYTVPGQVYYNATRKLVLRGVDGIVFVADSSRAKLDENLESFQNLEENLSEYGYELQKIPTIIQWNKRDVADAMTIDELGRAINKYQLPTTEAIAFKGTGVFESLKLIGKVVIDELNRKYSRPTRRPTTPVQRPATPAPAPQAGVLPPELPQSRMPSFGAPPAAPEQPFQMPQPQSAPKPVNPFIEELSPPPPPQQQQQQYPPRQTAQRPPSSGFPADYNTIDLEPAMPAPAAGSPFDAPPAQNKSDLDLEIERYQREIQQVPQQQQFAPPSTNSQGHRAPSGGAQQPGPRFSPPPSFQQPSYQQPPMPVGDDFTSFEVNKFPPPPPPQPMAQQGQQQPYAPPQQGYGTNQGYRVPDAEFTTPQPFAPGVNPGAGGGQADGDRMYFTSVDTDRAKRGKKPVNPKNKPKGGLLGKLFNKG